MILSTSQTALSSTASVAWKVTCRNGLRNAQTDLEANGTTRKEVEQGLVSFQTLLEHHTDLAFDFFEAWSLRNIFAVPPDLPLVLPHQEGLDLTLRPEREQELMDENAELRRRLSEVRCLELVTGLLLTRRS